MCVTTFYRIYIYGLCQEFPPQTHKKKNYKVLYIHTCCHFHGNLEEMHADENSPLTEVTLFSLATWNFLKKEQNKNYGATFRALGSENFTYEHRSS